MTREERAEAIEKRMARAEVLLSRVLPPAEAKELTIVLVELAIFLFHQHAGQEDT